MSKAKFDTGLLGEFTVFVQKLAKQKRDSAGYAGEWSDRGASELLGNLETFVAGLNGEVPQKLSGAWAEFMKTRDAEFAEFLEMKKKMEARYGKID